MTQPFPHSPHPTTFNQNIHCLTPKQKAIHNQTVQRHLSVNKQTVRQTFSPRDSSNSNLQNFNQSQSDLKTDEKFDTESDLSRSHSVIKPLPNIVSKSKPDSQMRKNRSAPSLSAVQQHKIQTQLYLHPTQIPRSLSATFADYQPSNALNILMDLPMEAYMGIGSGDYLKTMLHKALKQADKDINALDTHKDSFSDEETEDLRSLCQKPTAAPFAIPPSVQYENDLSAVANELPAPPSPKGNGIGKDKDSDIQYFDKRAHAQSVKNDIEQALKQGYTLNLCIAVVQALLGAFLYGWNVAILNVPQSVVQNDETKMTDTQYALLATMFCAGGLIGALVAGPMQDKIGRKRTLCVVDIAFILSAFVTYFYAVGVLGDVANKTHYFWFWLGRFLVGIACGAATAVVPTYLGEIAPPLIRGAIGTSNQLTICFGVCMVELVGYKSIFGGANTWQYLFVGNALPLLQLLTLWSFPESPKWLVQMGRDSEARKALQRLRSTKDVRVDMMLMKGGLLHEQNAFHSPHVSPNRKKGGKKGTNQGTEPLLHDQIENNNNLITVNTSTANASINTSTVQVSDGPFGMTLEMWKAVKWATVIAIVLMLMQQFSGINAVFYYSSTILNNAGVTSDEAVWLGSVSISVANFFAVFIAVFSIDRAGRKLLLLLSCVVMGCASVLVSIAIMLESHGTFWQYSSIGFLILFVIGFEIGLGAIPWLMMAELAPMQYRGNIVAIATASNWGSNLLIAQFSGPIIKIAYFYPFAIVCLLGGLFTIKYIPETNGKTAAEIQKELQNM